MKPILLVTGILLVAGPVVAITASPEIFTLSPVTPPAGSPPGTLAGTFTALDRSVSESETWTFDLVAGTGDDDNFRFQIEQDRLLSWAALAAGSYSLRARASGSSGASRQQVFDVQVGSVAPDADGDGIADEVEAFLGSDPADASSRRDPQWQVNGPTFRFVIPRAADLSGLDGHVEVSDDLKTWRCIAAKIAGSPWVFGPELALADDGAEVEISGALAVGRRFYRLRAETSGTPPDPAGLRALSVIVDFAGRTLEDYSGAWSAEALDSPAEVRAVLGTMEDHWTWMSTGEHVIKWDLVRIRLDQPLLPGSFAGWSEFRAAVADKLKARVNPADYDVDGDGVIDVTFFIVSNNDEDHAYLVGGSARVNGINSFSDGQASNSVRSRAIGNFNHEAGHNLGLVDIYGSKDTVKYLSLMSDSWPLPPFGFSAFDRYKLGWVAPMMIAGTTTTVVLNPAEEHLEAVMIPTDVASEYFLVEYRRKPASGFGSATDGGHPAFDGLAIYHVNESKLGNGNNNVVQPLLKLETPDGLVQYDVPPSTQDFWYPGNPSMGGAFLGKSYFAPGTTLFRIENFAWQGGGIRFDVVMTGAATSNLVLNPDFSDGVNHWTPDDFSHAAVYQYHADGGPDGSACVSIGIEAGLLDDARFVQRVQGLTPGGRYVLSGWIRGEAIELPAGAQMGANVSVLGGFTSSPTNDSAGTFGWKPFHVIYIADDGSDDVAARLGFYGSTIRGHAWFDRVSLVAVAADY
jgi:hypothetical protein